MFYDLPRKYLYTTKILFKQRINAIFARYSKKIPLLSTALSTIIKI